jgi:hypothetical protein
MLGLNQRWWPAFGLGRLGLKARGLSNRSPGCSHPQPTGPNSVCSTQAKQTREIDLAILLGGKLLRE